MATALNLWLLMIFMFGWVMGILTHKAWNWVKRELL
jgi:hypothetical protein